MKKKYLPAELEIILFNQDVITTSIPEDPEDPANPENGGGSGIGGGYNPGGWT